MNSKPINEQKALTYYINSHGKSGTKVFIDNEDKFYFLNLLRQQSIKSNLTLFGYVLLPRQYSFLVETSSNNLSNFMHRINSDYANYFNRRHKRINKLFKERYSCFIIDKKYYLVEISRNMHLMPKSDGVTESVFKYKWSSLQGYINKKKRENWIDYDSILGMLDGKGHKASFYYQRYIKEGLKKQIKSSLPDLKGRKILGSKNFERETLKKLHLNRNAARRDEDILAKKIIESVVQSPSWHLLRTRKKFNLAILSRNAAIYFLKKYTDFNNQRLSTYFKPLKKSSISQMHRRFNLIKERHKAIKKISISLEKEIRNIIENRQKI